jgi:hypothetical protein
MTIAVLNGRDCDRTLAKGRFRRAIETALGHHN